MENSKVKMVVPAGIGALSISGVEFDIVDGHTTVPHTMIEDAMSHGLTVYVATAVVEAKTKSKPAKAEDDGSKSDDPANGKQEAPAATGLTAVVEAVTKKVTKAKAK